MLCCVVLCYVTNPFSCPGHPKTNLLPELTNLTLTLTYPNPTRSCSNLVKDQIRRAYLSLGDFYLQCLSLPSATKYYARSRDYCSSSNQVLETNIAVMETSLRARDWNQVESSAARAMGVISGQNSPNNLYDKEEGRVHLARGLSYLACGNYSSAFSSFSLIDFDSFSTSVVSHQDVALYTALAGLAVNGGRSSSVDQANATTKGADPRERSKTQVSRVFFWRFFFFAAPFFFFSVNATNFNSTPHNKTHAQFLSSAPQCLRNLLSLFSSGSYGPAITLLTGPGELSDWIRVDPFLSSHTSQTSQGGATNATNPNPSSNTNLAIMSASLITAIKTISLVKYYSPYSSVLLQRLGDEFGMELPEVIASVKDCVEKGLISGRIDLVDGVLREDDGAQKAKAESERQLLDAMDNFAEEGAAMVWRASAMEATGALHSSDPRHKMTKSRGFSSKRTQGRRRNKNQESSLSSRFFREQQGIYTDSDGDDGEDEDDQGFGGERQVAQMEIVE